MTDLTRSDFLRGAGRLAAGAAAAIAVSRLDLTRLAYARAASSAPEESGAAGDGITDDTRAFRRALAKGVPLRLSPGRVYRLNQLAIGPSDYIWSEPGAASVLGPTMGKTIMVRGGGRLEGFNLVGKPEYHIQHEAGAGAIGGLTLQGLTLTLGNIGFYTFGYGQRNAGMTIASCRFERVGNPLIFEHAQDSEVRDCVFAGSDGSNVLFRMAQRCKVTGGSMDGGLTGVTFLGNFSNTGFGSGTFENNLVQKIRARNMREETISFDTNGTADSCLCRERAQVASKASDARNFYVTLNAPHGSWRGASGKFANAYLCIFSGAAAGSVCRIAHNEQGNFIVPRSGEFPMTAAVYAALARGDEVVIGLPFIGNAVDDNQIDMATGPDKYGIAILYYGMSFSNRANGNIVRMQRTRRGDLAVGMQICSLSAVDGTGAFVSGKGDLRAAPCVDNLFKGNRIEGGDMALNYNDFGNHKRPYLGLLNRTEDNVIRGGRRTVQDHEDLSSNDQVTP